MNVTQMEQYSMYVFSLIAVIQKYMQMTVCISSSIVWVYHG
jgi:hypothetical protein